jgi:hypothetical protein
VAYQARLSRTQHLAISVAFMLSVAAGGNAAPGVRIPPPLRGVLVSIMVERDGRGIFTHRYRVRNPSFNGGRISDFDIDIRRHPGEAAPLREGLINGPRYWRYASDEAFAQVPMVPVGITGPDGWIYLLGFEADRIPPPGFAGWGAVDEYAFIRPGSALAWFELTSYGLPGIRDFEIHPDVDYKNLPPEFAGVEKMRQLRERLVFRGKTVGPRAPAERFVSLEFLNYLVALVHDSRRHGWIRGEATQKRLLARLTTARGQLERGQIAAAKNTLNAFLEDVQAVSCREFTCPGDTPLTSEAHALLFFNGQFLFERL